MGQTWHHGGAPTMDAIPRERHVVQVWRDGLWCWSFRVWTPEDDLMVAWGAGIAGSEWGASRLAERCSRLAERPVLERNMRCSIVARLGRCDGLGCYRPWWSLRR